MTQPLAHPDLWARIAAHDFDDGPAETGFAERLARTCRWRRTTAQAAIAEYRRFAYLAVTADHPVIPSLAVDLVWHQHLTHSRNYWDGFCAGALRRPLHHAPSPGGAEAAARMLGQYEATLASYERAFGEAPPRAFWPVPTQRFARRAEPRWYSPRTHLLVPRRIFGRVLALGAGAGLAWLGLAQGWTLPLLAGFMLSIVGALGLLGAFAGAVLQVLGFDPPVATGMEVGISLGGGGSDGGDSDGDGGGCGGD